MAARRSRTGCATCRKRKLKCDETKPVCGQCTKSRRECIPSDGIAFRHEQNAGLNTDMVDGGRSLGNFYKYRNDYTPEQMKSFIPLPPTFEWRYITDVYAEDADQTSLRHPPSPQAYQHQREVASHSLEALSSAAVGNQSYEPTNTYADLTNLYPGGGGGGYGPASGPNQNNNIKFLLNPSSTPSAMIDPNLNTAGMDDGTMKDAAVAGGATEDNELKLESDDKNDDPHHHAVTNEEQVAYLLKNFDEPEA